MAFDREKAFGKRLNIAAGTAVRFEPGEEKEVEVVPFGGARKAVGFSGLVNGDATGEESRLAALQKATDQDFKNSKE
jgi:urease beta subunit